MRCYFTMKAYLVTLNVLYFVAEGITWQVIEEESVHWDHKIWEAKGFSGFGGGRGGS